MRSFFLILIFLAFGCSNLIAQEQRKIYYTNLNFLSSITSSDPIKYTYEVYQLPSQTYGYVIFANGEKYLRQSNMPGKTENQGFQTKEDAKKVAELVLL